MPPRPPAPGGQGPFLPTFAMPSTKTFIRGLFLIALPLLAVYLVLSVDDKGPARPPAAQYPAIGVLHTSLQANAPTPRQGRLAPETHARIAIFEEYQKALATVQELPYLVVLFHMHLIEGWDEIITPPEAEKARGIFATRSPYRPNPIGMTIVKLDSVSGGNLFVSGVDMLDGTPVLDIKPYIKSVDCVEEVSDELEHSLGLVHEHEVDTIPRDTIKNPSL